MDIKKKIFLIFIVAFLILAAIAELAYFKKMHKEQSPEIPNVINEWKDPILISRNDGVYKIDISTPKKELDENIESNWTSFAGLPAEAENVINSVAIISQDKSQAIIISMTVEETKNANMSDKIEELIFIKKSEEFLCNLSNKSCSGTDFLASAYRAVGEKGEWFNNQSVVWDKWDSVNNILYGYRIGENINISPVYAFDLENKTLKKTESNSFPGENNYYQIPSGTFSPTLSKFAIMGNFNGKLTLFLYDSSNFSSPLKEIDISKIKAEDEEEFSIESIAWSADEKKIVLACENEIYKLDLESGEIISIYIDMSENEEDSGIDSSALAWSPSGKYVVFVDYDRGSLPYSEDMNYTVLKAIDLENGNNVTEIFREEGIILDS